ncbi:MAG: hypothetical protein IT305_28390 [Chloroflexi bacterium]|nr:hypothetical protein [Chloroflexota bacterium]
MANLEESRRDLGEEFGRPSQRLPWQQLLLDDIFLLFMAGMVIPTCIYIIWGLMSLGEVQIFPR